ncbi:diaminopimelate decarboxylase [Hydrogenophaga crassostreae]|uniref:Diaminopimelate decarboxylase n=1 Tax=Hydrogenophaga crassostreae TaxID=1763535 RepID=A0A167IV52_9BURK|nr:diaminopimelate decarboxylase [Hydrogenophaga crassostreae]AOW14338.1 diaminopimelate decarboxylase [Hydrogenophaga crassostreae]OAD43640.1 diaminopimelate decarboxylase [Hydrogenophaga crassostreae]
MNPFSSTLLRDLATEYGTPLWVYDAATIRQRINDLKRFDTVRFAQKANSNLHLLRLMRDQGVVVDAVSRGEIERALAAGFTAAPNAQGASGIVFTADLFDHATLDTVVQHAVPVNAGSIDMLGQLGQRSKGHRVWLRINPGFGHGHSNKTNTGGEHSKHGIWHTELPAALAAVKEHGLHLVGLHMHIGSGVDYGHLEEVCAAMVTLVKNCGADLEAISAGGGLSIPYQADEPHIDTDHYFSLWDAARREIASHLGHAVHLELEPGRYLVAEAGVLLAEVRATKFQGGQHFTLVDAGFSDLMRPSMYGAFHGMSVIPADDEVHPSRATVVAGPLCESGDVFTQAEGGVVLTRELPEARVGDLLVLHDAGAYGASMSSNYNSRPLAAEVLVTGKTHRLIRRRQTIEELLALENA